MSILNIVSTAQAPAAIGPYSQAVTKGEFIFCSGQIGLVPATGVLVDGKIEEQTRQALRNLQAVLTAAGSSLADVVKTTVYLVDIKDFPAMNKVYSEFFSRSKPARSTVVVNKLPKGALVEIEAIALAD